MTFGLFEDDGSFFTAPRKRKGAGTASIEGHVPDCRACKLDEQCYSPRMPVHGQGGKGILFVAEGPGEIEDLQNKQLIGDAGQLYRSELALVGLDLERDGWTINAVNCRPPNNRKPTKAEIRCCRPLLNKAIEELQPRFIWLLGGAAIESFYFGRYTDDQTITRWRGWCIPDRGANAWVLPQFHPSFLLRKTSRYTDENLQAIFRMDLTYAASCLRKGDPKFIDDLEDSVHVVLDFKEVCRLLRWLAGEKFFFFDYETTGLKPYKPGHKILTVAVATNDREAWAFPLQYPHWNDKQRAEITALWVKLLRDPNIKKGAHNIKFEELWSRQILGAHVEGWQWDSEIAEHIIDDREKITGLKFAAYRRWGVEGYEKEVASFIKSVVTNGVDTGFNRMEQVPLPRLLVYNGIDARLEFKLHLEQSKDLRLHTKTPKDGLVRAYNLFHDGTLACVDMEQEGIPIDVPYYEKEQARLEKEADKLATSIMATPEAKQFEQAFNRPLDTASGDDMRDLIYKVLAVPIVKTTKKSEVGNERGSVEASVLEHLGTPFAKAVIRERKLRKTKDTYIEQFKREVEADGLVHPFFHLSRVRTYRSSSSDPNFQNQPIRDLEMAQSVRTGIVPVPGQSIAEADYGSMEVRILGCYSQDETLLAYINNPKNDMHRDQGMDIWVLDQSQIGKWLRFHAKNGWVFAQFYGSYYRSCARELWEVTGDETLKTVDGVQIREHLASVGIHCLEDFEAHLRDLEKRFWERFAGVRDWQFRTQDFYRQHGYVESFFGHRRGGYLDRNKIFNSPVQGTAFHCLLWSLIRLLRIQHAEDWRTRIRGQIHDSIFMNVHPQEEKHVFATMRRVMADDIKAEHAWLITPLEVEIEKGKVGAPWIAKEKLN